MGSTVSISQEKLFTHLEELHSKYESVSEQLSKPEVLKNQVKLKELSRKLAGLKPIEEHYLKMKKYTEQRLDTEALLNTSDEADMKDLAREEIGHLNEKIQKIENEILKLLVIDSTDENRNVFLEIRAGAGGNEASLFASDLLRMYSRIAEQNTWKLEIISTTYSAIGGIKEIILHITGNEVNQKLQFESGVHRVQRVPVTEASGRIHTSTVTVAVMPEADDVEIEINARDIRIDTFSASGPGGQHVNRTQSAIRITHNPTGIVVTCQDEKSQHKNKEKAMKVLKARLFEFEKEKQESLIANSRKSQVGSGERSEKIRTYNFPQNRVTDHRITGRNFNLETILNGLTGDLFKTLHDAYSKKMIEEKLNQIVS
jgi:peptide chain release factor 1